MKKKLLTILISLSLVMTMIPFMSYAFSGVITGFEMIEDNIYTFKGNPTLDELTKSFPKTIDVRMGDTRQRISVSWKPLEAYDRYDHYSFVFVPVLDGYEVADGIDLDMDSPYIIAFREADGVTVPEEDTVFADLGIYAYASDAKNEEAIYQFLTEDMGLNMAAACGVLANMYNESGLLPNNLENTVNKSLDMTDSEYTKAVNKGERNFKKDDGGYGLCQWTGGRRGSLYNFAKEYFKEGFNIADLTMQLEFFKQEITESYPATYSMLKQVPNNEIGAYMAAAVMCGNFESPSNTEKTAIARGKTCLESFWDERSDVKSDISKNYYFGLCAVQYPTKIAGSMICYGYVVSNKGIDKVKVDVTGPQEYHFLDDRSKEEKKPMYYSFTASENKKGKSVDDTILFSKITEEGNYTYSVEVTDVNGKVISFSKDFTVGTSTKTSYYTKILNPSELALTDANYPKKYVKGEEFVSTGKVTSNYDISQLTVGVKDQDGKTILKNTTKPEEKAVDVIAPDLSTLAGGKYTYFIYAKDYMKTSYLLKQEFGVESKAIKDFNLPESIEAGKDFEIQGKVTSDLELTSVQVKVLDANSKVVTSAKATPEKLKYDLSKLNKSLDFSKCKKGTYTYKVTATDQVGTKVLIKESFKAYAPSTLKITGATYPKSLKVKKGFTVTGTVKSNYKLKLVRVSIIDSKGNVKMKVEAEPNAYSYSLQNLDKSLKFGTLKKGTYTYKVYAKDPKKAKVLLKKKFTVK
ncbi:MAG: phage tail tip lysozyme [Clostridia bacterium]|nr:phage tail tip lysozyme [Clostridia bacterium]